RVLAGLHFQDRRSGTSGGRLRIESRGSWQPLDSTLGAVGNTFSCHLLAPFLQSIYDIDACSLSAYTRPNAPETHCPPRRRLLLRFVRACAKRSPAPPAGRSVRQPGGR